ncbi:MAG: hypothetical protein FWH03_00570 [Firmicutes bacterium]|nr:hypothetical protein [Bacillota bacterium]
MQTSASNCGLFLLDSPTGYGKTTTVVNYIMNYFSTPIIQKQKEQTHEIERIFFVTNLKKNLPIESLQNKFGHDYENYCLFLKPYWEDVVQNFDDVKITDTKILYSDEYKNLKSDIGLLVSNKRLIEQGLVDDKSSSAIKKAIKSFEGKIEKDSEPKFRYLIKKNYFENQSTSERKGNLKKHPWIEKLYPICNIENYRIILLSTKKFFSPIDTFTRVPFYIYDDFISKNAIVFIDEFDATKGVLLDQIIEDSLKIHIDVIKLFLNIYYSLKYLKLPKKFYLTTKYFDEKVEKGDWHSVSEIERLNKEKFEQVYNEHNLEYLLKTKGFDWSKIFLFDDNREIVVFKDSSKKTLRTFLNKNENITNILAESKFSVNKELVQILIDIKEAINYFINALTYLSENYQAVKNERKDNGGNWFFFEEAVETMLSAFNISEEFRPYLYKKIVEKNAQFTTNYKELKTSKDFFMRKGFQFTEVADSNYHDLQSKVNLFKFSSTPEDILVRLCNRARVIGISATASLETVIGNYDLDYIRDQLDNKYLKIDSDDFNTLKNDFLETQKIYLGDEIKIHTEIVDSIAGFDLRIKITDLLKQILNGEKLEKYLKSLNVLEDANLYHYYILIKVGYLYKTVGLNENIKSFLCFLNSFPRWGGSIDLTELESLFDSVVSCNGFKKYTYKIINSTEFDEQLAEVHELLNEGKKVFVITTYKTIGTGKNLQYSIPESVKDTVILDEKKYNYDKDFDGIYLSSPTNLVQNLNVDAEDKYYDISKYLFQQEYLYQSKKIYYYQFKENIINAFKKIFYNDKYLSTYTRNDDLFLHNAQVMIQAVGRICRCRNKNKNIYIYLDLDIVEKLSEIKIYLESRILNEEFKKVLQISLVENNFELEKLSEINKNAHSLIEKSSWRVRDSEENVKKWVELRDFVLKNPTCDFVPDKYKPLYFYFEGKTNGYGYKLNHLKNFTKINTTSPSSTKNEISATDCELRQLLKYEKIEELFRDNGYAKNFKSGQYIMTPSLYKQVYQGALGEVIGKRIIEELFDIELEEIKDHSFYEFFDYKYKNLYFDFKNWTNFTVPNIPYQDKLKRKLRDIKGKKCIVINVIQRGEHLLKHSDDGMIIKIPYIFDFDTEGYSKAVMDLQELIDDAD